MAKDVRQACTDVGFFYGPVPAQDATIPALKADLTYSFCSVKNHGIPEELIDAVISASKLFFSLPEEEKIKVGRVLSFYVLISRALGCNLIRISTGISA